MEERKQAQCAGKDVLPSKAKADALARKMRRKYKQRIAAYRCDVCRGWHVGSGTESKEARQWSPSKQADRPTVERRKRGEWVIGQIEKNGPKVAKDIAAHPIDRLEYAGVISNAQASAARDYEDLYRRANEVPQLRDSTTIWEPHGHSDDDGPVDDVRERRELYLFLGTQKDRVLRYVCVEHNEPRGAVQTGLLRESLNECCRWFRR